MEEEAGALRSALGARLLLELYIRIRPFDSLAPPPPGPGRAIRLAAVLPACHYMFHAARGWRAAPLQGPQSEGMRVGPSCAAPGC